MPQLTDLQIALLASEISTWIAQVDRVEERLVNAVLQRTAGPPDLDVPPDQLYDAMLEHWRAGEDMFTDAYLLPLALRQIRDHVHFLTPVWSGEFARRGQIFRTVCSDERIEDLRNVLEHAANYIAEDGMLKPELRVSNQRGPTFKIDRLSRRLTSIGSFGREYPVDRAIESAIRLGEVVDEIRHRGLPSRRADHPPA